MASTEITFEILNTVEQTAELLTNRGFNKVDSFVIHDRYFSRFPLSELLKMDYAEILASSVLVRKIEGSEERSFILYKDKKVENGVTLSEDKVVSEVSNFEECSLILRKSGLCEWCDMLDFTVIFAKDGIELAIQKVEGLGLFIEIEENESVKNLEVGEKIEKMISFARSLGLSLGNDSNVKKPYMIFLKNNNR